MTSDRSTAAQDAAYQRLDEALDGVDASVFSGELLYIDGHRELLKTYIERWSKAIAEHELMALLEGAASSMDTSIDTAEQGEATERTNALEGLSDADRATLVDVVDEIKGLCKDFSDRLNRPMMGDVTSALDGLIYLLTCENKNLFKEKGVVLFLNTLKQTCMALSKPHTPLPLDAVNQALDKVSLEFGLATAQ